MNNFYDDEDIFSALGLKEEWEDEETADVYAEEDARILKEYGFWFNTFRYRSSPSLSGYKYSYCELQAHSESR